jgi:thiol-disulfide isomerase/thioredoxin
MKKQTLYLILITFFTAQFGFATTVSEYAAVKGIFSVPATEIKEITIHAVKDGKVVEVATAKVNALGEFGFMLPITTPGFYYVDFGQLHARGQLIRLYLEPKLDIELKISPKDYELGGKNIGKNALVKKANEIYNEFTSYSDLNSGTKTYIEFYPFLDGGLARAEAFSKSINTKDVVFNKLLKLAVETDVEELTYIFFRMPKMAFPEKNNRPAVLKQWVKDKKFTDPDLLKLANGSSLMSNYFFYGMMNLDNAPTHLEYIPEAINHITDPVLKDVFLFDNLTETKFKMEEYEKMMPILKPYLISERSKEFLTEYETALRKSKTIGQKGFDFTYNDIDAKPVSFSDFKGKYVYIDLWATWCAPCKGEIPYLKKLEEEYHDKNIVFISLSLDESKDLQKWKDFVKKEGLKGIQMMADNAFKSDIAKNYEVTAIPRFLLFDTNGNIITTDAMRPSSPELRLQLDKLLKL